MVKEEFDSSKLAYEIYNKIYCNLLTNIRVKNDKKRPYFKADINHNGKQLVDMNYGGDRDFNFGSGFSYSTFPKYQNYIQNGISDDKVESIKMYYNNLKICQLLYRSGVNISIMPQTGALNIAKKQIGNDRLDTFIWALEQYYSSNVNLLMNASTYQNAKYLKEYLEQFDGIEDYCSQIYHINSSLVEDMVESGKKAIDSPERVIEYMNLAYRFWTQKLKYLESICYLNESIKQEICRVTKIINKFYD